MWEETEVIRNERYGEIYYSVTSEERLFEIYTIRLPYMYTNLFEEFAICFDHFHC